MSINYKKITYPIGTSIELHCTEYWPDITGDYEVIGITNIESMSLLGLDLYTMHFTSVNQDDYYNDLLRNNVPIYILKAVNRNPFEYTDITQGVDEVTEYLYLADSMIDKNNTVILVKRIHVTTNVNIGTYNKANVTDAMEEKLTGLLVDVLDDFSDKYRVEPFTTEIVLQPQKEAIEEDRDYKEKQERLESERLAKIEAERKRLEILNNREVNVANQEQVLIIKVRQIQDAEKSMLERQRQLEQAEIQLERERDTIQLQYQDLAEKTAALNERARKIRERENQLGIPNSNL